MARSQGSQVGNFFVGFGGDASGIQRAVGNVSSALSSATQFIFSWKGAAVAGLAAVGLAAVRSGQQAVTAAAAIDSAFREVATLLPVVSERMDALKSQIRDLSTRVPEPPAQLTGALYQAISAGARDTQEALELVEVASKGAVAGLTDTETVVDAVTTILNAYQLEATEAGRVTDVLFKTVEQGKIRFEELASTIGKATNSASLAGVSVEELGAAMATMTKFTGNARRSATALNRLFLSTTNLTTQQKEAINNLGVEFSTASLKSRGLVGFLQNLEEATDGNIDKIAEIIPSIREARAAFVLAGKGASEYRKILSKTERASGVTQRAFKDVNASLENQRQLLDNEINAAWAALGEDLLPMVIDVFSALRAVLESDLDESIRLSQELGTSFETSILKSRKQVRELRNQIEELNTDLGDLAETNFTPDDIIDGKVITDDNLQQGLIGSEELQDLEESINLVPGEILEFGGEPLEKFRDMQKSLHEISTNVEDISRERLQNMLSALAENAEELQKFVPPTSKAAIEFRKIRLRAEESLSIMQRQVSIQAQIAGIIDSTARRREAELATLEQQIEALSVRPKANEEQLDALREEKTVMQAQIRLARTQAEIREFRKRSNMESLESLEAAKDAREEIGNELQEAIDNDEEDESLLLSKFEVLNEFIGLMEAREEIQKRINELQQEDQEQTEQILATTEKLLSRTQDIIEALPEEVSAETLLGLTDDAVQTTEAITAQLEEMGLTVEEAVLERQRLLEINESTEQRLTDAQRTRLQNINRILDLQEQNADLLDDISSKWSKLEEEIPEEEVARFRDVLVQSVSLFTPASTTAVFRLQELVDELNKLGAVSEDTGDAMVELFAGGGRQAEAEALVGIIRDLAGSIDNISTRELDEIFEGLLPEGSRQVEILVELVRLLAESLGLSEERTEELVEDIREAASSADNLGDSLEEAFKAASNALDGLADAASGLGIISDEAESAIRSLSNLTDSLGDVISRAKEAGGLGNLFSTAEGLLSGIGVIGSAIGVVGNIAGSLFGESPEEKARKKLLKKNNQALRALKNSLEQQREALLALSGDQVEMLRELQNRLQGGQPLENIFRSGGALEDTGLTMRDLQEAAEALGVTFDEENLDESLRAIQEALEEIQLEDFFKSFRGEIDALQRELELFDIDSPLAELRRLREIFLEFTNLPSDIQEELENIDLTTSKGRKEFEKLLQELFRQAQSGELGISNLGDLTVEEFLDQLANQEQLLDEIAEQQGEQQSFGVDRTITEVTGNRLVSIGSTQVFWLERIAANTKRVFQTLNGGVQPPTEEQMKKSGLGTAPNAEFGDMSFDIDIEIVSGANAEDLEAELINSLVDELDQRLRNRLQDVLRRQGRT